MEDLYERFLIAPFIHSQKVLWRKFWRNDVQWRETTTEKKFSCFLVTKKIILLKISVCTFRDDGISYKLINSKNFHIRNWQIWNIHSLKQKDDKLPVDSINFNHFDLKIFHHCIYTNIFQWKITSKSSNNLDLLFVT